MLAKNVAQEVEVKFCGMPLPSKAWGKGVGRMGGLLGTVGTG